MKYFLFLLIFFPLTNSFADNEFGYPDAEFGYTTLSMRRPKEDVCLEVKEMARYSVVGWCNEKYGGMEYLKEVGPPRMEPVKSLDGKTIEFACEQKFEYRCKKKQGE